MTDAAPGVFFTLCALVIAASLLFAALARPWPDRRASAVAISAAALGAIFLLAGTIWLSTDRLADVRLRLRAVTFAFDDTRGDSPVSFGGNRNTDHVVIAGRTSNEPRMSQGSLAVRRTAADPGALEIRSNGAQADRWSGIVFAGDHHPGMLGRLRQRFWPAERHPLGAIEFGAATALCLPTARGHDIVRLAPDGKRLTLNGSQAFYALPSAKGEPALIHDYAAVSRAGASPLMPESRSVLLRKGGGWQIVILDPGAYAVSGDCGAGAGRLASEPFVLRPGEVRHLSFHPLSPSEPWQIAAAIAAKAEDPPKSRLVERRSGTVAVTADETGSLRLAFTFDSPESLRIAASDIGDGSMKDFTLSLGGQEDRAWGLNLAATRFRATGTPLASGFAQRLELSSATAALIGDRTVTPIAQGQTFQLGTRDRARVALERLDLGWSPLAGASWLALAGLVAGIAATWGWRRRSAYVFIILAMADFLLTMRLLVAIEAAVIDPSGPGTVQAIPAAVLALGLVPVVLAALAPAEQKIALGSVRTIVHTAIVVAIAVHVFLFNGLRIELLPVLGAAFLLASWVRLRPAAGTKVAALARRGATRAAVAVERIAASGRFWLAKRRRASPETPAANPFAGAIAVLLAGSLLLAVRLLLPEQLLGFRTAIIYTPLWLAYCGFAFRAAADAIARELAPGWGQWALWFLLLPIPLLWALFSFVGGDPGFAVVNAAVLVVMVLLLTLWFRDGAGAERFVPALPSTLAAAVIAGAMLLSSTSITSSSWPDPTDSSPAAEQQRLEVIEDSIRASRVERRIQAWFTPARLAESGTREAEELTVALQQMRQYGSQGWFGRGYLNQPEPTELRLYQLNDNVSAVHLLTPFGRMGTAAFLLVLGCGVAGATWRRVDRTGRAPPTYGEAVAYVALWTLFVGSTYMVLANLQLVPFTGRNVFLLAASSTSDLIEGVTLLAVALVGLRPREGSA